jgi:hypothetical protein
MSQLRTFGVAVAEVKRETVKRATTELKCCKYGKAQAEGKFNSVSAFFPLGESRQTGKFIHFAKPAAQTARTKGIRKCLCQMEFRSH